MSSLLQFSHGVHGRTIEQLDWYELAVLKKGHRINDSLSNAHVVFKSLNLIISNCCLARNAKEI